MGLITNDYMIIQSFITLIVLQCIVLVAIGVGLTLVSKIPPREMYLLLLCLIFEFFSFFMYSINAYYSKPNYIDPNTIIFSKIGYFLSQCTIMVITYAFLLIDFKYTYIDFFELLGISWLGTFTATYNSLTVKSYYRLGSIQSIYTPLGEISIIIFLSSVIFIWVRRFVQISRIYSKVGNPTKIFRSLLLFIVVGICFMSIYVFMVVFYHYEGDNTFIMSGLFTIVGTLALYRNNAFLFITDIKLDSILIIEKRSGILLYSKGFNEESEKTDDPDFLSSVISAIDIGFSNTIKSRKGLAEMNFSDKTVLIYSGKVVSSILIVSSPNLIAKSISRFIVKKFEKSYGNVIIKKQEKNNLIGVTKDYKAFDTEVAYIRMFLPL